MNNVRLQPFLEDQTTPSEQQHDDVPQLALVTLTPQNKQRLLHNAIKASEHAMEPTQAIMARLEQYDPDTARLFGFKNVAISKAPLRLLCPVGRRIKAIKGLKKLFRRPVLEKGRPDLMSSSISTSDTRFDSFIAISYCWHNEDWKPVPECQPREGWPVSLMMLNELLLRRESENEGLWIDACCIDQNNEIEKKHAIGAMDLIYKSARIVYFLLEDVHLSNQEVEALRALLGLASWTPTAAVSQIFPRLISSRWFTRAWCSHEYQLAADPWFLVPTETIPVAIDKRLFSRLYISCGHILDPSTTYASSPIIELTIQPKWLSGLQPYRRVPMAQFKGIFDLNSLHETDKIGIAANVAGLQLHFTGSEMSVQRCRWILAMLALSAGDLSSLCGTGHPIPIRLSTGDEGHSWLRWNHNIENFEASLSPPLLPQFSQIVSIHPEHIILDLHVLERFTLHTPSTVSMLKATAFMNRYAKEINNQTYSRLKEDATSPDFQRERRRRLEILACSLDCGLAWLMNNMLFHQGVASEMQRIIDLIKFDLWPMVTDLLIDVYPHEESTISSFTSEQKQTLMQSIYYTLFEMGHMTVTSFYDSSSTGSDGEQCLWLEWGPVYGKALTFMGAGRAQLPECKLAVPTALCDPSCATMERLWLLKPADGNMGNEWIVIEKIKLVTLQPLEDDGGNLVRRREQIIRA